VILAVSAAGCVTVMLDTLVAKQLSVTVTVYVPASSPVAVALVCAGVVLHAYVYGEVPFDAPTVALPVDSPLIRTCVVPVMLDARASGCVSVTVAVVEAPLPSVTVTVYEPAANPVAVAAVWALVQT
jgi:hypothetical protein